MSEILHSNSNTTDYIDKVIEQTLRDKHIKNILYGVAFKFTRNWQDAEDLIQDTILKVLKTKHRIKINMLKDGKIWMSYLFTIMKNTFIDNYRSKKEKRKNVEYTEYSHDDRSTYNEGEDNLMAEKIEEVLSNIHRKGKDKEIMDLLKKWHEYQDIAEDINSPIGTIKARINRARFYIWQALIAIDPEYYTSRTKTKWQEKKTTQG